MVSERRWYAVYTKPKWEKKVAALLSAKDIENYCPMNRTVRQWADRKKIIDEPLFRSYVFICINLREQLTIQQTTGVLNFVFWLGKPAVIKPEEIDAIKNFLLYHQGVTLEKIQVNVADRVRILDGPLLHQEGKVMEVKGHSVKVSLPSLGCILTAEVPKSNIEILHPVSAAVKIA